MQPYMKVPPFVQSVQDLFSGLHQDSENQLSVLWVLFFDLGQYFSDQFTGREGYTLCSQGGRTREKCTIEQKGASKSKERT